MPTFKYEGAHSGGEKISGVVEATSREAAVAQIRQSCEVVLSIKEISRGAAQRGGTKIKKINFKTLALSCKQFAIVLKAGLPLVQTVNLVSTQCEDKQLQALLAQVSEDVSNGWSLSYSFEQRGGDALPATFRETIRAGEETGGLLEAFERMSSYLERMNKTRSSVTSAMIYPSFVIVAAVVVVGIIMVYAVPTFTDLFEGMNVELPWVTEVLIGTSHFFQNYFVLILVLMAAGFIAFRLFGATEKGGMQLARGQLKLPLIGDVVRMSNSSQFAHTLSAILASGMPIMQAIDVSGRTMQNLCMSREILETLPGVEEGRSFGECLSFSKELPDMLREMIAMGESTGSLESTLLVLADYYDNETDVRVKRALSVLEPAIIVVLAIFVVFILLAVYLPMFNLNAAI